MPRTYLPDLPPDLLAPWDRTGRSLPAPPQVKQAVLRDVARAHGLRFLVETGTYLGDTAAALAPEFDALVTIELDPGLHQRARQRFAGVDKVICLHGDSGVLLPQIMARLAAPTLFWLDAHYSGPGTARGEVDTPVLAELRTILRHPSRGHVVVIDDARLFGLDPAYPTVRQTWDLVRAERPDCAFDVAIDMVRVTPGDPSGMAGPSSGT
jgi:predicted O-methyltransferase YrrM